MRVVITVAYDGTSYFGSQIQKETPNTVFGAIEKVFKALNVHSSPTPSGRTDKGVHATGQVFHIDLPEYWQDIQRLKAACNAMLPTTIQIKKIIEVETNFHARYSAKKRSYRYIIKDSPSNPFEHNYVTFLSDVNFKNIQENIALFKGEHDFENFMKTGSDTKSSLRVIYKAFAYKYKGSIILYFQANGFLRSQIRMMVGSLLSLSKEAIDEKLNLKKNHKIKLAPANGLYLVKIQY